MGITIKNKNKSIDMGTSGFYNLRSTIAGIYSESFKDLYQQWTSGEITDEKGNAALQSLYYKGILTDKDDVILDFLFASDIEGKISYKTCKRLYKIIKDYDDNIIYGYWGRPDATKFKDFKEIVEDCAKNRRTLYWN